LINFALRPNPALREEATGQKTADSPCLRRGRALPVPDAIPL
jgi:hypothetical protein